MNLHIIHHEQVSLNEDAVVIQTKLLHPDIQKAVPTDADLYIIDNFIYYRSDKSARYPYDRLTIELVH